MLFKKNEVNIEISETPTLRNDFLKSCNFCI